MEGWNNTYLPKSNKTNCLDWLNENGFWVEDDNVGCTTTFEQVNKAMVRLENGKVDFTEEDLHKLGLYWTDTFLMSAIIDATLQINK